MCITTKMKDKLIQNNIEVRKSQKHGYGIFATDFIKKGTVIEECHYIKFKDHRYSIHEQFVMKGINEYKFDWPINKRGNPQQTIRYYIVPLGYGSIYNSSKTEETANAEFFSDLEYDLMVFMALCDIKKDEEILTFYGYKHALINKLI